MTTATAGRRGQRADWLQDFARHYWLVALVVVLAFLYPEYQSTLRDLPARRRRHHVGEHGQGVRRSAGSHQGDDRLA